MKENKAPSPRQKTKGSGNKYGLDLEALTKQKFSTFPAGAGRDFQHYQSLEGSLDTHSTRAYRSFVVLRKHILTTSFSLSLALQRNVG